MSTELELKTRIAILEKDLELAKQRELLAGIELSTTSRVLTKVVNSIIRELTDR